MGILTFVGAIIQITLCLKGGNRIYEAVIEPAKSNEAQVQKCWPAHATTGLHNSAGDEGQRYFKHLHRHTQPQF